MACLPSNSNTSITDNTNSSVDNNHKKRQRKSLQYEDVDKLETAFFKQISENSMNWVFCEHLTQDKQTCGTKFIHDQSSRSGISHNCYADQNHQSIKRDINSVVEDCEYDHDNNTDQKHCIRFATLTEIAEYQSRCKRLGGL